MIVASMIATGVSAPSASIEASASHTVIIRPARTTRPRALDLASGNTREACADRGHELLRGKASAYN
jgi:hypothetical protein